MEDEFTSYIEFENEDGETIELAICDYFEYEGDMYVILADEAGGEDDEETDVCVLKVIKTDDGEEFTEPDEEKIPELQRIVEKIFYEADDCDCDCDNHDCDCDCGDHDCDCDNHDCDCDDHECGCDHRHEN